MVLRNVPRFARREADLSPRPSPAESRPEDGAPRSRPARGRARSAAKLFREIELTRWLMTTHDLGPAHARAVADRLLSSAPRVRGAFHRWWLTGLVEDLEVEGFNLRRLVEEKKMSPLGALLTLSLLEGPVSGEEIEAREDGDLDLTEALDRTGA